MQLDASEEAILRQVLDQPTAPFHEQFVARLIRDYAQQRGWGCEEDPHGNLYVTYRRGRAAGPPLILEAHMDHPGFHVESVAEGQARLSFLGKVPMVSLDGVKLLYFKDAGGEPRRGTILSTSPQADFYRPLNVVADAPDGVEAGDFAVFDLPTWRLRGHRLSARAHDDLAQVAAVLCALSRMEKTRANAHAIGLFTRAEEVGFIGAYGATDAGRLPAEAVVISLECSGLPGERGLVVRCGDKTSVFDGWATTRLMELADAELARNPDFLFQTPVPRRGTCNASLYQARGWTATGLTLPMENYHNWGNGRVRPEIIDLRDWHTLVGFLATVCTQFGDYGHIRTRIQKRMDTLWRKERRHLRAGQS